MNDSDSDSDSESDDEPQDEPQDEPKGESNCLDSYLAWDDDCRALQAFLYNNQSPIPKSPRNINWLTCYVTWDREATGVLDNFFDSATLVEHSCMPFNPRGYWTAGWETEVNIGGTYLTQCLSNSFYKKFK